MSASSTDRRFTATHKTCAWRGVVLSMLLVGLSGCQYTARGQNSQGVALFQTGQYQQAATYFQEALKKDPANADAYYNLAASYHQVGKLNRRTTELDQAELLYNKCLDYNPNHQECYRALAVLLVDKNQPDKAQRLLEGWYNLSPTNPGAKIELARLREEFGDRQSAKDFLQQALVIDPYEPRALAALGRLQESEGNVDQALANYQRSLYRNQFQPELAARVNSLQTTVNASRQVGAPGTFR
ncbi:MAG: tetratricopeptide repeat protein [Pirellulales bacterium]